MAISMVAMASELYRCSRSDPEYFLPSHRYIEQTLDSLPTLPLFRLGRITCSAFYPAATHLYAPDGIPFLRCVDIIARPVISPDQPFARIPISFANAHSTIRRLKSEDIVISKVGSPCFASLLSDGMEESAMTRTVLGMSHIDRSIVDPYYLIAFLRSRYGFDQLMRERELTIQYQLTLDRTRKVRVYLPSLELQEAIGGLVRQYYRCQRDSIDGYGEAQQLLGFELGLVKLTFQKPVGYTARFSDVETSRRFDPEHYYPAFANFADSSPGGISLSPLAKHLTFCQRGKQPIYATAGLPVINSKHVQPNRVLFEGNRLAAASSDSNLQIRHGDTLLNGTGRGTLGRAAPYLIHEPAIPDNHVTILRSDDLDPVYLSLYLNSAAGQMQVEMHQRGTSGQLELYPFDVRKFLIWLAPQSFQQELRRLHDKAAAAERESKQLLEQAKSRVEQLIEEAARG